MSSTQLIEHLRSCVDELEKWESQRAITEERLTCSEQEARGLLEAAPDAVVVVDVRGTIVLVNAQVERLFGYRREELIGQRVEQLVPERFLDRHRAHRESYVSSPSVRPMGYDQKLFARHKEGTEFPVEISLSPFQAGEETLISSAIRDVSQRVKVERQLRAAKDEAENANRIKSQFLAAASHDLRQPLQAARLYLEVAASEIADCGLQQPNTLQKVNTCLDSLAGLLERLLNVAKLDAGGVRPNPEVFPLSEIFERLSEEFLPQARDKGLRLRCAHTREKIESDPELLHQVLANLVANAVRYTEEGRILVGCRRSGSNLLIQVWDTGVGISEEQLDKIFEEFYQVGNPARSREHGVGLGLAIVQRVSRLLGGELQVRSTPGRGSVFGLLISRGAATNGRTRSARQSARLEAGLYVAVIDDDPLILEGLQLALVAHGHEVAAADAEESMLRKLRVSARAPSVVVSDYRLQEGRTGVEALEAIRAEFGSNIPAVLLTGDTSLPALETLGREKQFRVLSKPVTVETLNREIGRCLAGSPETS